MATESSEPGSPEEFRWVLEPPGAGQVQFLFRTGPNTVATPEQREALEKLVNSFHQGDVEGFARVGFAANCPTNCDPFSLCNPEYSNPCVVYVCDPKSKCTIGGTSLRRLF